MTGPGFAMAILELEALVLAANDLAKPVIDETLADGVEFEFCQL